MGFLKYQKVLVDVNFLSSQVTCKRYQLLQHRINQNNRLDYRFRTRRLREGRKDSF